MAVTPPASMSKIRAEFGGSGRMSGYKRGGGIVPDHANTAPISVSAPRMSQFNNTSRDAPAPSLAVNMQDSFANDFRPQGGPWAWAGFRFSSDGNAYTQNSNYGDRVAYRWISAGDPSQVQVMCTVSEQSEANIVQGVLNQWIAANAGWNIECNNFRPSIYATLYIQFRNAANGQLLGSCSVSLSAQQGEPI